MLSDKDLEEFMNDELELPDLVLEKKKYKCTYKGVRVELSPKLYNYLVYLAENADEYLTYEEITSYLVLSEDALSKNKERINKEFKKTLKDKSFLMIKTKSSVGYKINLLPDQILIK